MITHSSLERKEPQGKKEAHVDEGWVDDLYEATKQTASSVHSAKKFTPIFRVDFRDPKGPPPTLPLCRYPPWAGQDVSEFDFLVDDEKPVRRPLSETWEFPLAEKVNIVISFASKVKRLVQGPTKTSTPLA